MASLPQRRPSLAQRFASSTIYQTVADFFAAPTVRGVRFAAVAAALLLLMQAALITGLLVRGDGSPTYQTASGQSDDKGVSALGARIAGGPPHRRAPALRHPRSLPLDQLA